MPTKEPSKIYNKFDVVVVPFPFIDVEQTKRRPALILSSSLKFNHEAEASTMAMITSASHSSWPLDVEITDLKSAGLPVKSIVRMKLFTLDHRLILHKLGTLSHYDQDAISKHLKELFSL